MGFLFIKDFQYKHKIDRFVIIGNFKEAINMFQIRHLWNQDTTGTILSIVTIHPLFTIFSSFHFQITKIEKKPFRYFKTFTILKLNMLTYKVFL